MIYEYNSETLNYEEIKPKKNIEFILEIGIAF